MQTNLYVIYDKVALESGPIFEAKNDGVAFRRYNAILQESDHPDDFQLLKVGLFDHDNNTGEISDVEEVYINLNLVDQLEEEII
jgi:hypothetical protein